MIHHTLFFIYIYHYRYNNILQYSVISILSSTFPTLFVATLFEEILPKRRRMEEESREGGSSRLSRYFELQ